MIHEEILIDKHGKDITKNDFHDSIQMLVDKYRTFGRNKKFDQYDYISRLWVNYSKQPFLIDEYFSPNDFCIRNKEREYIYTDILDIVSMKIGELKEQQLRSILIEDPYDDRCRSIDIYDHILRKVDNFYIIYIEIIEW